MKPGISEFSAVVLAFCLPLFCALLGVQEACTPSQRADVASAVAKDAPCLEACAPLLIDEVIAAKSDDAGTSAVLAFSVPPPPRSRVTLHRRCTAWAPVDSGADAREGAP